MARNPEVREGNDRLTERPTSLLALALWAGIVTGWCEIAVIAWPLFGPDFAKRSRDAVWMVPAFDGGLFALLGVVLCGAAWLIRIRWRVAAGGFAALGVLLVLLLFPRLHQLAALMVAVGVGTQVARLLDNRVPAARRGVQQTLPWLVGSLCLVAVFTLGWGRLREHRLVQARPAAPYGLPNVLILILDTVRAVDLSVYGYARRTTPELEAFAERGTVFDLAFAPSSWTGPSHASMFTGRWPFELDINWSHNLSAQWPTLAEVLHARGYATGAFVANRVYTGWESGLMRGFEHYEDYPPTLRTALAGTAFGQEVYPHMRRLVRPRLSRLPLLWRLPLPHLGQYSSAEQINRTFLAWLERARPAPFFAFLNFMDAHVPYTSPDSFRLRYSSQHPRRLPAAASRDSAGVRLTPADERERLDKYDGSIAYLDSQLGDLIRELERRHLLDNTLIIVSADHGEEFAEHGLAYHGYSLYRLSLHVPLLVSFPGRVPAGRRVTAAGSLRNLAATVLDLVAPGEVRIPGRSLARFWTGADTPDTIVADIRWAKNLPDWYPVSRGDINSIAFDGLRYIRNEGDGAEELYDFRTDVLERWNLVQSDSGRRLLPRYRAALAALSAAARGGDVAGR